ncbi:MAG: hypothetical protein J5636_04320 [Clostridiales bacterium]|nr:hypothetical protein [Clostridiales bacterium]
MRDKYETIRGMDRPQYPDLPPMPLKDRAAQFSPFAAVVGYGDAVLETARLTDDRVELHGDAAQELDRALGKLRERINDHPEVSVSYFVPDGKKAGGRYIEKTGAVRRIDEVAGTLVFKDGLIIPVSELRNIRFIN